MRFVQIQTTSACNARCKICPYKDNSWMIQNPGKMSDGLFEKILSELQEWERDINTGKFCPYLMNEPFADPKILDKIELIREMFPNALIEISTNAELMTPKKASRLYDILRGSRHDIWISRHGVLEETVGDIMKIDGKRSLDNILNLLKISNGELNLRIKGFLYSIDNSIVLNKPRDFLRYWTNIFKSYNINTKNLIVKANSFHNRSGNLNIEGWNITKQVRRIGPENRFYCPRVDEWIHILWNGDVILCCNDYHHETCFGNLQKQTIKEVLKSEEYKQIYDKVLGNVETEPDFICNRCTRIGG